MLELLVVLVLLGLLATLAMPNLERFVASITRKTERDLILDQLAGLGRHAMLQRRGYVVFGSGGAPDAGSRGERRDPASDAPGKPPGGVAEGSSGSPSDAGHERYVIDLPEGWEIRFDEPLVVRANGVCLGAELTLLHRGEVDLRADLDPPYCRIDTDA